MIGSTIINRSNARPCFRFSFFIGKKRMNKKRKKKEEEQEQK